MCQVYRELALISLYNVGWRWPLAAFPTLTEGCHQATSPTNLNRLADAVKNQHRCEKVTPGMWHTSLRGTEALLALAQPCASIFVDLLRTRGAPFLICPLRVQLCASCPILAKYKLKLDVHPLNHAWNLQSGFYTNEMLDLLV